MHSSNLSREEINLHLSNIEQLFEGFSLSEHEQRTFRNELYTLEEIICDVRTLQMEYIKNQSALSIIDDIRDFFINSDEADKIVNDYLHRAYDDGFLFKDSERDGTIHEYYIEPLIETLGKLMRDYIGGPNGVMAYEFFKDSEKIGNIVENALIASNETGPLTAGDGIISDIYEQLDEYASSYTFYYAINDDPYDYNKTYVEECIEAAYMDLKECLKSSVMENGFVKFTEDNMEKINNILCHSYYLAEMSKVQDCICGDFICPSETTEKALMFSSLLTNLCVQLDIYSKNQDEILSRLETDGIISEETINIASTVNSTVNMLIDESFDILTYIDGETSPAPESKEHIPEKIEEHKQTEEVPQI